MAYRRTLLRPFSLANSAYADALVYAYEIDPDTNEASGTLADIFTSLSGTSTASNPIRLSGTGQSTIPLYFETPVVLQIGQADIPDHETGIIYPASGAWRGAWVTGTAYYLDDIVQDTDSSLYLVTTAHTSAATLAADVSTGNLELIFDATAVTAAAVSAASTAAATAASAAAATYLQAHASPVFCLAITTPDGVVSTGTDIDSFIMPRDFYCTGVYSEVRSPVSGFANVVDININGATMLSTKLNIDLAMITSRNSVTQAVISTPIIAVGSKISVDVDTAGTTYGLKVMLLGYWT